MIKDLVPGDFFTFYHSPTIILEAVNVVVKNFTPMVYLQLKALDGSPEFFMNLNGNRNVKVWTVEEVLATL